MKLPILLVSVLIAAALIGFFALRGTEEAPDAAQPKGTTPSAPVTAPEELPATSPGRTDAAEEGGTDQRAGDGTTGSTAETPDAPNAQALLAQRDREILMAGFEDRHGHLTVTELRETLATLEETIEQQRKTHFEDRFNRGIYDVQVMGAPPLSPPEPDARGRLPLRDGRTTTDPTTMRMEAHIATLPFDEFPDFYQLLDERDWLQQRIGN